MNQIYLQPPIDIIEDSLIVLSLSLAISYLMFTIMEYYKPSILIDLGQTKLLI